MKLQDSTSANAACADANKAWFYPNGKPAFVLDYRDHHWLRPDGTRIDNVPLFDHPIYTIMWLVGLDPSKATARYVYQELNLMYGMKLIEDSL